MSYIHTSCRKCHCNLILMQYGTYTCPKCNEESILDRPATTMAEGVFGPMGSLLKFAVQRPFFEIFNSQGSNRVRIRCVHCDAEFEQTYMNTGITCPNCQASGFINEERHVSWIDKKS